MRFVIAALAAALLAACAAAPQGVIPRPEGNGPIGVAVVPVSPRDVVDETFVPSTFMRTAGALTGFEGWIIGAGMDAIVTRVRLERTERLRAAMAASFAGVDVTEHLLGILDPLPELPFADLRMTEPAEHGVTPWVFASEIATGSPVDAVVILHSAYRMSPATDRLAVTLLQYSYRRRDTRRLRDTRPVRRHAIRRYTYLSPQHPLVERPFRPGEKAALAADIRERYEGELAHSEDRDAILAARDAELEQLEALEHVPDHVRFAETWTPERTEAYMAQASEHLRLMLQMDWARVDAPIDASRAEQIEVLRGSGPPRHIAAVAVADTETHTVMRAQMFGNLYAVPKQRPVPPAPQHDTPRSEAGPAPDAENAREPRRRPCVVSDACDR